MANTTKKQLFKRIALGTVALAGLSCAAFPALADVKAGVDAWSAGNYERAVQEWQVPASNGDADALFNLAQAHRLGRGVPADIVRAKELYAQAAERGHVKAADNYGLLLFQQGEQQKAMPFITAAAERGDPRAQYVLGLAHFNADYAPKDWVRGYALMTLANGAELPQARTALAQMDQYVPLAQRQQAQSLARQLEANAARRRSAELAAVDLGTPQGPQVETPAPVRTAALPAPPPVSPQPRTQVPVATTPAPVPTPVQAPVQARAGNWRVQLGAFGVRGNADRLWSRLQSNPALAGTNKALVPAGKITRLHAVGFASRAAAQRACDTLKAQGQACLVQSPR